IADRSVDETPRLFERAGPAADCLLAGQVLCFEARAPPIPDVASDLLEVLRLDLSLLHRSPVTRSWVSYVINSWRPLYVHDRHLSMEFLWKAWGIPCGKVGENPRGQNACSPLHRSMSKACARRQPL